MANRFIAMVFAVLKDKGVDADGLSVDEAVEYWDDSVVGKREEWGLKK